MVQKNTSDFDKDLNPIIEIASNDELEFLVNLINDTPTGTLANEDAYIKHSPNHVEYADLIAAHIRMFGGNTLANVWRTINVPGVNTGIGPKYYEIVCDVAKKMKVKPVKSQPIEVVEQLIISKLIENTLNEMSDDEKIELLKSIGITNIIGTGPAITAAALLAFRAGGFASYKLAVTIVNCVLKKITGKGLSFVGNQILTKALKKILGGSMAWVATGSWLLIDIASPAMRITVPAVIYIAMLRKKYNTPVCQKCEAQLPDGAKFCPECGTKVAENLGQVQTDWVGTAEGIVSAKGSSIFTISD